MGKRKFDTSFIVDIEKFYIPAYPNIVLYKCNFSIDHFESELFSSAGLEYPIEIQRAVNKRKAEFFAGRYVAQQALADLGIENYQVMIGLHRCPIWPINILGSITHTDNIAICATAPTDSVFALGIDLEKHITPETIDTIKYSIICREEEELLSQLNLPFNYTFTLVFSAKESLFKALYPNVGRYFDFNVAKLCYISLEDNIFCLSLKCNLSSRFKAGFVAKGHFNITDTEIFTSIVVL